jgi:hypothetical protein
MSLNTVGGVPVRIGAGSLGGEAKVGTPLCPDVLVQALIDAHLMAGALPCALTAFGTDSIGLIYGDGTLSATVGVVVEADNPADAPEFLVMTGTLRGGLQIVDPENRLIAIWGTFTPENILGYPASQFGLGPSSFTGKVRLPFVKTDVGNRRPHRRERAFYLGDDGKLVRVQNDEISLGQATARFELNFPKPAAQ